MNTLLDPLSSEQTSFPPLLSSFRCPPVLASLCFKERNPSSVVAVVSAHGITQPWSSTCALTAGPCPTSARCAWSSAVAWLPCRDTSRATQCRTFPPTGASRAPTCTPHTSELLLTTQTPLSTQSSHRCSFNLCLPYSIIHIWVTEQSICFSEG